MHGIDALARSPVAGSDLRWKAGDGVGYRLVRAGSGPALVCLHGFTGSAASWAGLAAALAPSCSVLAPDLLGHGGSDAPGHPGRYDAEPQVADLYRLLENLGVGPVALLGYSMGARLALAFAATHPGAVACLVLEGGSPGIVGAAERAARRAADEALAARIERDGMEAFVTEWERLPLWESQAALPDPVRRAQRAQRLANSPVGLANCLRGFGQGTQPPLWDALPGLGMPVLAIAGDRDKKYARLAAEIAAAVPRGRAVVIEGAGHAPHVDRPGPFRAVVGRFLAERGWIRDATRGGQR